MPDEMVGYTVVMCPVCATPTDAPMYPKPREFEWTCVSCETNTTVLVDVSKVTMHGHVG